jgi:tripartite-type tricarboxylate transporter receptor subunit TctC
MALRALIGAAIAILLLGEPAAAAWPERAVRWIVAYPAGAGTDIVARLLGQRLTERLGKPVMIENKPGAGGALIKLGRNFWGAAGRAATALRATLTWNTL